MVDGLRALSLPLGGALLGLGIAAGGFLAYNKVEDLVDVVSEGWGDGWGLQNDPAQTQEQVTNYIPTSRVRNPDLKGMSAVSIYELHYDMRDDLCQYFSRMWCEFEGLDWTGPNHEIFLQSVWSQTWLATGDPTMPTFRFERAQVLNDANVSNEISEYTYQMIIRETDSRNTQARLTTGAAGLLSYGIGTIAAEGLTSMLRKSGFMRAGNEWDGQNWEEAPGANFDPLLNYAWARTDFQTGKWWSTVDSQGDVSFWLDVANGGQGSIILPGTPSSSDTRLAVLDYEGIIWDAHREMTDGEWGPVLIWLSEQGSMPLVNTSSGPAPPPPLTQDEIDQIEEEGRQQQEDVSNESGRDDYMPGEEPPEEREEYGPPRS